MQYKRQDILLNSIMCSLKLIVTIFFALALNVASSGVEPSNDNIQQPQKTSVQPEEIHSLFSNATVAQTNLNGTAVVSDKKSVSSINDTLPKSVSQDLGSSTTTLTSIIPTLASVSSTSISKLTADAVSDQSSSTAPIAHNVEFPLEGGGTVASTSEHLVSKINVTSMQSNESLSLDKLYSDVEQNNKTSTVVGRKGAEYKPSKIVPRKGVGSCPCCPNATSTENCTICCISPNESSSKEEIDDKGEMSIQGLGNGTTTPDNNTLIEQRINSSTVTEAKKTKATKPLYTVDAANDNVGNASAIQTTTKKLEQGSNYVVPVVGTILMVPLIAVLSVFMYKKGCEFWERRHYRRMDFLIDGMYND